MQTFQYGGCEMSAVVNLRAARQELQFRIHFSKTTTAQVLAGTLIFAGR